MIGVHALRRIWKTIRMAPAVVEEDREVPITRSELIDLVRQMQEQLEDHHQSINQDTDEIQQNHAEILQLRMKIESLREELAELRQARSAARTAPEIVVERPTMREQEVFMVLYTTEGFIGQAEIAKRLGVSQSLVTQNITNLMEKGIPVTRRGHRKDLYFRLDPDFKQLQAKENVAGISEQLTLTLATQGALS